jgi:hypothetical protein
MRPDTASSLGGELMATRDGARLTVRPIAASDKPALESAFEHLGDESRYSRFPPSDQAL